MEFQVRETEKRRFDRSVTGRLKWDSAFVFNGSSTGGWGGNRVRPSA